MATNKDLADALDAEAGRVLRALQQEGGEADTSEIREATNLSNGQVRRRREQLVELGLIDASQPHTRDNSTPPTVHELTGEGEAALDHGLLSRLGVGDLDADPEVLGALKQLRADVDELLQRVDRLEERQTHTEGKLRSRLGTAGNGESSVADELADLREEIGDLDEKKKDKRRGLM